jgi:hypothetical protein
LEAIVTRKVRSSEHDDDDLSNERKARLLEIFASAPGSDVKRLAIAEGYPARAVERFLKRMRTENVGVAEAVRAFGHNEMVAALGEKMTLALQYITPEKMAAAGVRDIAIVFGILAEKRELLQGKPTQIFSFEERRAMKDIMPAAFKEAMRRGMVIDGTYTEDNSIEPRVIQDHYTEGAFNKSAGFKAKLPTERNG